MRRQAFPAKWLLFVAIVTLVLISDQWTKRLIRANFHWGESRPIVGPLLAITYVRNQGAAFGILHRAPTWFRDPIFIIIPVMAMFLIFFLLVRLTRSQWRNATALSLILGGAIGNLMDRLRFGYVIDFLDLHWHDVYHWPAFNVADSCIVVGVALLFLETVRASGSGR